MRALVRRRGVAHGPRRQDLKLLEVVINPREIGCSARYFYADSM